MYNMEIPLGTNAKATFYSFRRIQLQGVGRICLYKKFECET
jgi:hypothetical protein